VYDSTASNALDMYLKDYLWYATQGAAVDDNPIYLFEKLTGDHRLLGDYTVPKYFTSEYDLFTAVSPPLITARWLLLGPPRSGSNIHFDPNHTSAWNTLLLGHKKWVLFPPDTPEVMLKTPEHNLGAAGWFANTYPKTVSSKWPSKFKPVEILQEPGETIFLPAGWWHAVLNLDFTVCITQNFAQPQHLTGCAADVQGSFPHDIVTPWLSGVLRTWPELKDAVSDVVGAMLQSSMQDGGDSNDDSGEEEEQDWEEEKEGGEETEDEENQEGQEDIEEGIEQDNSEDDSFEGALLLNKYQAWQDGQDWNSVRDVLLTTR